MIKISAMTKKLRKIKICTLLFKIRTCKNPLRYIKMGLSSEGEKNAGKTIGFIRKEK